MSLMRFKFTISIGSILCFSSHENGITVNVDSKTTYSNESKIKKGPPARAKFQVTIKC